MQCDVRDEGMQCDVRDEGMQCDVRVRVCSVM